MAPTVVVFLLANPRATAFGRYPNCSIVFNTYLRVAGLTFGFPLTTRETVAFDTFASLARSYIVIFITFPPSTICLKHIPHIKQRRVHVCRQPSSPVTATGLHSLTGGG